MTLFLIFLIVVIYLDTYTARLSFYVNLFSDFIMAPVFYVPVIQLAVYTIVKKFRNSALDKIAFLERVDLFYHRFESYSFLLFDLF